MDGVCDSVDPSESEGLQLAIDASEEIHGRLVSSVVAGAGGVASSWLRVSKPGRSESAGKDTCKHKGCSLWNERSARLVFETMPLSTES